MDFELGVEVVETNYLVCENEVEDFEFPVDYE